METSPLSPTSTPHKSKPRSRVSHDHTLTRVRENQRRHRARRRDYIQTLEQKLQETEQQLAEARAEIEVLRRERQEWRGGDYQSNRDTREENGDGVNRQTSPPLSSDESSLQTELLEYEMALETTSTSTMMSSNSNSLSLTPPNSETQTLSTEYSNHAFDFDDNIPANNTIASLEEFSEDDTSLQLPTPTELSLLLSIPINLPPQPQTGPPPCCPPSLLPSPLPTTSTISPTHPPQTNPECLTCSTRPPPSPNESTTLCSQAYILIAAHNFRGIDAYTIRSWLVSGFRAARTRGEGCRVENGRLLGLLDFISGV